MKMFKVELSQSFLKKRAKLVKGNPSLAVRYEKFFRSFMLDPYYPSLKTHKVEITNFGLVYSSRVTGDIRILWKSIGNNSIIILTTGGHEGKSSVYK